MEASPGRDGGVTELLRFTLSRFGGPPRVRGEYHSTTSRSGNVEMPGVREISAQDSHMKEVRRALIMCQPDSVSSVSCWLRNTPLGYFGVRGDVLNLDKNQVAMVK